MEKFLKLVEFYQQTISLIDEKININKINSEISNLSVKIEILTETKTLIELTFDVIYKNYPKEIKYLTITHYSSEPVVQQLEQILNSIGFDLFITSKNTFDITNYNPN